MSTARQVVMAAAGLALMAGVWAGSVQAGQKPLEVAVIVKATESDFWQYVLLGGVNYGKEHPDRVKITTYGPPSEADVEQQVNILENVISQQPDAIVMACSNADAVVPGIRRAKQAGIVFIALDAKVNTDRYDSFLATDNITAGGMAADKMVELLKASGHDLKSGKIGIIASNAGLLLQTQRVGGFTERMKQIAPSLTVMPERYAENDIQKGIDIMNDIITAEGDELIGVYASNNAAGNSVSRAISENNLGEKVVVIAFDSDPEEIRALRTGTIDALVLQDPYGMGYRGVDYAWQKVNGKEIPKEVDTGVNLATRENMNSAEIAALLDPTLKKID
ncbi:MAG: ABC transporter substrate-binding protein [Planctomycetes bacterium]|nr:ABC transporter substrate-binding protein [Planctomycetota bacterium]